MLPQAFPWHESSFGHTPPLNRRMSWSVFPAVARDSHQRVVCRTRSADRPITPPGPKTYRHFSFFPIPRVSSRPARRTAAAVALSRPTGARLPEGPQGTFQECFFSAMDQGRPRLKGEGVQAKAQAATDQRATACWGMAITSPRLRKSSEGSPVESARVCIDRGETFLWCVLVRIFPAGVTGVPPIADPFRNSQKSILAVPNRCV